MRRLSPFVAVLALATGCVAPARSAAAYEGKAASTAGTARSAVATARLVVALASRGRAFAPFVSTALADAEDDLRSAQGLFDSITPPDPSSDRLRTRLDALLTRATARVTALRVRARWTAIDGSSDVAGRELASLAARLAMFVERYG